MPRIVSVWLPAWPIERLRRANRIAGRDEPWAAGNDGSEGGSEPPFALVESSTHGLRLTAVNACAWNAGLRTGLALADARAAVPALLTRPAEPERDRAALTALAYWSGRYGPRRHVEGADGLWVDISGVAHLFGGEARLLDDLVARLARVRITARVGLADTAGAAFALARFAACERTPWRIAAARESRDTLAALPVEALRLAPESILLLKRLGLRRIGQLYDLPREALALRFRSSVPARAGTRAGPGKREREAMLMAGAVLVRLDRALGLTPEPRVALEEPPVHLVRQVFAEPLVSAEGVAATVAQLAQDLGRLLEATGEGGTRFSLSLYRTDGTFHRVDVGASRPSRSAEHLVMLLAEKLATLDAGFGIDAMTLEARHVEALGPHQIALGGAGQAAATIDVSAMLDRLSNRLGPARVVRLVPAGSHIPERAERRVPVLAGPEQTPLEAALQPRGARPAFLLPVPEPITVIAEVPEGPPRHFTWRRLVRRIVRAQGPERIEPEWWRAIGRSRPCSGPPAAIHLARARDYYAIEDANGGRYWVFRAGLYGGEEDAGEGDGDDVVMQSGPVWFVHGIFA